MQSPVGGLEGAGATVDTCAQATGQFDIADDRSVEEVADYVRRQGFEVVWKDWDGSILTTPE
jgi:2-iminoacetate synthase